MMGEKKTCIQISKRFYNYKGEEEWKTEKEWVCLKNKLWDILWQRSYKLLGTRGSKFRRVPHCIEHFPETLQDMRKLMGREFDFANESLPQDEFEK